MPKNVVSTQISIPEEYTPTERKAIASDIINYLVERTKDGKGPGNSKWSGAAGKYSESYKKSLDFKQKRSTSNVNLELSGDMLTAVNLLNQTKGKITVGISTSDPEWGRAKGNILGTYGQQKPIPGKARPFLEITDQEINKILKDYPLDDERRLANSVISSDVAKDLSKDILKTYRSRTK